MKQNESLMEQNQALIKRNDDLAALLEESQRKTDVMTKNWLKAKKNYISEKKANNRKYEELKAFVGELKVSHDATRKEVSDLDAAMHFVLERGHEGKYFDNVSWLLPYIGLDDDANTIWVQFWSKIREWKKTHF